MNALEKQAALSIDITVSNLGKKFNREWIFRNLNYTFRSAHTYAITGPNGAGKSTLLQVIWGQLPQSFGEIKYASPQGDILIDEIFKHLAIATPYLDLIEEFTLLEHLQFHFKLKKSRANIPIDVIIEKLNLQHAKNKQIGNFSSGMKQRVKLGLAFFTESSLIFLDEPTTNLDAEATAWYHHNLADLPEHCTVFIASNQPNEYPPTAQILNILDLKK